MKEGRCADERKRADGRRLLSRAERRRQKFLMQDGLRDVQRDRVAKCGIVRIAADVELRRRLDGPRAFFDAVLICGSVWACPMCGAKIRATRAEEVERVVEVHGIRRVLMLTLTVAHGAGDALKRVRCGVSQAMARLTRGEPWVRFKQRYGLIGRIRGLETTHGIQNGWHPHIHALIFLERPLTPRELDQASAWLAARWANVVERELGPAHRPGDAYGVLLSPCHRANYLAKLGLELTAPGRGKRAKPAHRTPFEIGWDYATERRPGDGLIWRAYCDGMFGAQSLTWSPVLRERFALGDDRPDEELVKDRPATSELITRIPAATWDRLLRKDARAPATLLEVAEREGTTVANAIIARLLGTTETGENDWGFESIGSSAEVR